MTEGDRPTIDLNPPALKPAAEAPWDDDALQRRGIAADLDQLVAELAAGAEPAAIALDGGYGTGKTFILERWVQEMAGRGQVAAYYNAWENDCDDDPLVSLIETLTSNDKTGWASRVAPALNEALTGILRKYTGIDAQKTWKAGSEQLGGLLDAARHRRDRRQKLKEILAELVEAVRDDEFAGVVVVVDELDRCRPTFANELMERVKHVLNVPGLVFVFGVNFAALRETVKVVYGNIDAHQYLLRMFTTTLQMPRGVTFSGTASDGRVDAYLQGLADRHGLRSFCNRHRLLKEGLERSLVLLGLVSGPAGLTPREFERVMWLVSMVARTSLYPEERASAMLPDVLLPLAVARVKDPGAYCRTVSRPDEAPAVINCYLDLIPTTDLDDWMQSQLDRLEMAMYRICHQHPSSDHRSIPPAYVALSEFADLTSAELDSQHLSRRLQYISVERAKALLRAAFPEISVEGGAMTHVMWRFSTLRFLTSRFDVIWPVDQVP